MVYTPEMSEKTFLKKIVEMICDPAQVMLEKFPYNWSGKLKN